jgi:hypothetical protein
MTKNYTTTTTAAATFFYTLSKTFKTGILSIKLHFSMTFNISNINQCEQTVEEPKLRVLKV